MQLLRVWVPASGVDGLDAVFEWAAYDAKGHTLDRGRCGLAELPLTSRTELILPFERVLLTTVTLPRQSRRQLQKVVPYALEDRLLTPPENSHCALGEPSGGVWPVAVVDRAWLNEVLVAFRAQRPVHAVWPGWYWLPVGARLWLGTEGWSRTQTHQGDYIAEPPATGEAEFDPDDYDWDSLAWSARQPDPQAINLLQGSLAAQPRVAGARSPWRWTAGLAAAVLLMFYGQLGWSVWKQQKEAKALSASITQGFYKVYPETASIVDPILQVERKLAEATSGPAAAPPDDFLVMLNKASGFIAGKGVPSTVDYQAGELKIGLNTAASAAEAMVVPASGAGLRLEASPPTKPDDPLMITLRSAGEQP